MVAFNQYLITAGADHLIRVWNLDTYAQEAELAGHDNWVVDLAVSGVKLISASNDCTVRFWSIYGTPNDWVCLRVIRFDQEVYTVAIKKKLLVIGGADKKIHLFF
eukprot:Platyproteum_vivax@DN6068_c0_g1_i2.p2